MSSKHIRAIIDEIASKASAPTGVVSYAWDAKRIATVPAVLVGLPEKTTYRTSYSRTGKKIELSLVVLVAEANARSAQNTLLDFLEMDGERSVFRLVDSAFTTYTSCDDVTVVDSEPNYWTAAGVKYLGAEFTIDVTATGV